MSAKTYISSLGVQVTFPVKIKGNKKFISLTKNNDYNTSNVEIQKAIEASKAFKSGEILLLNGIPEVVEDETVEVTEETPENTESVQDTTEEVKSTVYEDVTDIQGAVKVLKELGASHQSLRNPEAVIKKAAEMKVSFPNLSV